MYNETTSDAEPLAEDDESNTIAAWMLNGSPSADCQTYVVSWANTEVAIPGTRAPRNIRISNFVFLIDLVNSFMLVHQRHLGCRVAGAAKRRTAMRMGTANKSNCKVDGSGTVLAATHSPDSSPGGKACCTE